MSTPLRLSTSQPDFEQQFAQRLHWSAEQDDAIEQRVKDILADVRTRGDAAVLEYTARFDGLKAARMADLQLSADELQAAFGYRLGALRKVGARHLYPLALVEAQEQVRPHLVVLGNAAHSLHPIAGQGYNLSLRDTLELAESLLASTAPLGELACLQGYLDRQRLDQQMTVGFSDQVTKLFTTGQPLLVAGRNLGLLGLDLLPPAKRWFARQAMGLGPRSV